MFDEEFDDGKKEMNNVCVEDEKESVYVKNACDDADCTIKQARKGKRARKRRKDKKRKLAPLWLGGAPHYNPPHDDPSSTLLTSATAARWRVLGHHAGGDGDARSDSTPTAGMVSFFSFFI